MNTREVEKYTFIVKKLLSVGIILEVLRLNATIPESIEHLFDRQKTLTLKCLLRKY